MPEPNGFVKYIITPLTHQLIVAVLEHMDAVRQYLDTPPINVAQKPKTTKTA